MDILALSVWLRYLEIVDWPGRPAFPGGGYRGDYIRDVARELAGEHGDRLGRDLPPGAPLPEDDDALLDALIAAARAALGEHDHGLVADAVLTGILDGIRDDLARFGVVFDRWFSERELVSSGAVPRALQVLRGRGEAYEQDGALWFNAQAHGDEKDRVLVRANGQSTYFASDVAYHLDKFERGFDRVIDVWGADHHGYIARVKGAIHALGLDAKAFDVVIVQLASLWRGAERVAMSTRSGEFVTPCVTWLTRWARTRPASSTCCARAISISTSIWSSRSPGPTRTRCTTCNTRMPVSRACCGGPAKKRETGTGSTSDMSST